MEDKTGCLTLCGAYCVGSYMLASIGIVYTGWQWYYLIAPVSME